MDIKNKIAEVVAGTNTSFTAHCYKLNAAPSLGSLVKTGMDDDGIYGVVYLMETHGREPGRQVFARGEKLDNEEEIYRENPQLEKLLVTEINVLVLGYKQNGNIYHFLPPQPPTIHSFVFVCDDMMADFTMSLSCLRLIAEANIPVSVDEIMATFLRRASKYHEEPDEFRIKAGRELVRIYGGDIRRVNSMLMRLTYAD
jgi:hypothetical protein